MVQAIRDQWVIGMAVVVVAGIALWLLFDRLLSGARRRGR
jgi:hypothetical protein